MMKNLRHVGWFSGRDRYLGASLLFSMTKTKYLYYLVDKLRGALTNWKVYNLSMAGKATLIKEIKACFESLLTNVMTIFKLLNVSNDEMDASKDKFLLSWRFKVRRVHMLSQDRLFKLKIERGSAFKNQ